MPSCPFLKTSYVTVCDKATDLTAFAKYVLAALCVWLLLLHTLHRFSKTHYFHSSNCTQFYPIT